MARINNDHGYEVADVKQPRRLESNIRCAAPARGVAVRPLQLRCNKNTTVEPGAAKLWWCRVYARICIFCLTFGRFFHFPARRP